MDPRDAILFIGTLLPYGFLPPDGGEAAEIALIDAEAGFKFPCGWLQFEPMEIEAEGAAGAAWLRGTERSDLATPPDWKPFGLKRIPRGVIEKDYKFVGMQGEVEVRRNPRTGDTIYSVKSKADARKQWWRFWR